VEAVLHLPDLATPVGLRNRALLETLHSTGVRRTEVLALDLGDLDRQQGTLLVRQGKGNTDRFVPIGERAVTWIDKYLRKARPRRWPLPIAPSCAIVSGPPAARPRFADFFIATPPGSPVQSRPVR
jgi:integrase/recombinase XerD